MQNEKIKTGTTYTASAMVKTKGVTQGGGILKIALYDSTGTYLTEINSDKVISGDTDWTRVLLTLSEAEAKALHTNAYYMKVAVGTNAKTTGTVYFDAVRFQPSAITTDMTYDQYGYVTSITNPLGNTTNYTTNSRGNVEQINFPKIGSSIKIGYDDLDRVFSVDNATNLRAEQAYDANGNITGIYYYDTNTGLHQGTVQQSYNELDQITKVTDQNGLATTMKYDPVGNVTEALYPNGKAVHFGYDTLDQNTSISYTGESTRWNFGYDDNSNVTSVTKNGAAYVDYTIDPDLDRVTKATFPTVNGVRNTVSYTYLPSGQITSVNNSPMGSIIYEYDHSGRMAKVEGANRQESYHMYNEAGQLKKTYTVDGSKGYSTYYDFNELGLRYRIVDVVPYILWGNTLNDPTDVLFRVKLSTQGGIRQVVITTPMLMLD